MNTHEKYQVIKNWTTAFSIEWAADGRRYGYCTNSFMNYVSPNYDEYDLVVDDMYDRVYNSMLHYFGHEF